jgi:threonine dehydrogenase-like Zn-dependent dehydrogenase
MLGVARGAPGYVCVMKALTYQGREHVSVEDVPDPRIEEPTDAVVRVTSTAICGSDLHLYRMLGMYIDPGDVLGHETMGVVEEVGAEVQNIKPGDRVVVPFNISCGHCFMCDKDLFAQCETTQVRDQDKGAALFGFSKLYGQVPGGQAEYLRVPMAHFGPIPVPGDVPDERMLYLSDILPTAWQAVRYADVHPGDSLAVFGLGPVGQFAVRAARALGIERVIGVDLVRERLEMASRYGAEILDTSSVDDVPGAVQDLTDGRGADAVIDAVGMEAHGSPVAAAGQMLAGRLPKSVARPMMEKAGIDRLDALRNAIGSVRRGGTASVVGVYGGAADPMNMMQLFDKGVQLRMGQAHVKRWIDEIMPFVTDDADPLGTGDLATHHLPLSEAPHGYEIFQKKEDGCIKVVLHPCRCCRWLL